MHAAGRCWKDDDAWGLLPLAAVCIAYEDQPPDSHRPQHHWREWERHLGWLQPLLDLVWGRLGAGGVDGWCRTPCWRARQGSSASGNSLVAASAAAKRVE